VSALANPEVGDYLNRHFVSSFQKVGTFKIVGDQKQGGNVASYFCTPSGNVLEAIAGPVDAATLLREAKWVVETRKMAMLEAHGDMTRYKQFFRRAHAEQLPAEPGLAGVNWPLVPLYRPSEPALAGLLDGNPAAQQLDQQGKIHLLLALYPLVPLDQVYKVVYEKVLNETISTRPVNDGSASLSASAPPSTQHAWGGWAPGRPAWAASPLSAQTSPFNPGSVPTPTDLREQQQTAELRYARNNPPATEVCGAVPLNVLLADLMRLQEQRVSLRPVPLEAEMLVHVNVTGEAGGPTPGLLKAGGKLDWPLAWHEPLLWSASAERRAAMESSLTEALVQAKKEPVSPELLIRLNSDLKGLDRLLTEHLHKLSPTTVIQATRYLNEVGAALQVLGRRDAARYVDGTLALNPERIKTVPDLVGFMKEKGVKFAPAVDRDESAYLALQRALASCDTGSAPAVTTDRGDF
jgi:hypothetical protein